MTEQEAEIIDKEEAPELREDEKILASGKDVGMRLWEGEEPGKDKSPSSHDYETVGYVLKGKAELHLEKEVIELSPGDSYLVPSGEEHTYKILETFTAVEATSPPAHLQ